MSFLPATGMALAMVVCVGKISHNSANWQAPEKKRSKNNHLFFRMWS
jgi:hypothetical protein